MDILALILFVLFFIVEPFILPMIPRKPPKPRNYHQSGDKRVDK